MWCKLKGAELPNYDCRRCGRWRTTETQLCDGCGLYHFNNQCVDPYFNDPENWCNHNRKA